MESKLGLLERHLFRRKFGYATLDKGIPAGEVIQKKIVEIQNFAIQITNFLKELSF